MRGGGRCTTSGSWRARCFWRRSQRWRSSSAHALWAAHVHRQRGRHGAALPSGTGKRPEGKVLKGARDSLQERVLTDTFWCCYCCYGGCGTDGMDLPCCFGVGEVCCLGGITEVTSCWDQDVCFSTWSKCCCCLTGFECPIDDTPGIGCGPWRRLSNLDGWTVDDCNGVAAKTSSTPIRKRSGVWRATSASRDAPSTCPQFVTRRGSCAACGRR